MRALREEPRALHVRGTNRGQRPSALSDLRPHLLAARASFGYRGADRGDNSDCDQPGQHHTRRRHPGVALLEDSTHVRSAVLCGDDRRAPQQSPACSVRRGYCMIALRDKDTGADLGSISEEQLQFLVDQLEGEYAEDRDYYINRTTVEIMQQSGADSELINLLSKAIGDRDGVEIEWSRV